MVEMDTLERSIVARINAISDRAIQEGWTSDHAWTGAVLLDLARLGHEYGFYVCGNGCTEYGQGEWLYDLVWLASEGDYIRDVPLVLESEWSPNFRSISDDFMKLLVSRAGHRVMVFQQKTGTEVKKVLERLVMQVQSFQPTRTGDRYLFLGFDWAGAKRFNPELFVA